MQHSRLSEIDLARAMSIEPGPLLERAMLSYNAGGGAWSYDPTRSSTADIVGARTRLFSSLPRPGWPELAKQIEAACRRDQNQITANLEVSKLLYDTAQSLKWRAVQEPMGCLFVGFGESVRYWSDVLLEDEDGPFIPFFDHRRGHGLVNAIMRNIVFSMQHIGVRERNPDLSDARLAVVRFATMGRARRLEISFCDETGLLSYEELDARVREVYATWARVSDARTAEHRGASGRGTRSRG